MNPQQINNKQQLYRDDEIDLFDLLKILWKWRLFIIGITLGGLIIGFGYVLLKPNAPETYTAKVDIQIGKVTNVNIESAGDTYAFLQSDAFTTGEKRLKKIEISFNDFQDIEYPGSRREQFQLNNYEGFEYTTVLTLLYTDLDSQKALETVQKASSKLKQRHDKIYNNALNKFKDFKPQFEKLLEASPRELPFLWLDSYTYPTRLIKGADVSKNVPPNRTTMILALTTLVAFFISIMLAFLIEGIRNRIAAEKDD